MPISFDKLDEAYQLSSMGHYGTCEAWIHRDTNDIYYCSDMDVDDEVPGDLKDDNSPWVCVPTQLDLDIDLGSRLVMRFAETLSDKHTQAIQNIFSRRGAYRRFKDYLIEHNIREQWFEFEKQATSHALRQWAADQGYELTD